ncbi:MAG: mechanosensitive ion channel [Chloroflexi bacterium]|nr:mechanosensitive ion channel [Chloroflexota bacterium]
MSWDPQVWLEIITSALPEMLNQVAAFLPNLVGALFVLLVGWLLAWLAQRVARRLLAQVGFDRLARQAGVTDALDRAGVTASASHLVGRIIYWLLLLTFLMVAVESLGLTAAATALRALVAYLPRVMGAIIVLVGGALLGQFLGKGAQALAAGSGVEFHAALGRAVQYIVLVMATILAADQLGLNTTLLNDVLGNLLTVAGAGLALTFALGSREAVRNLLAGFYAKDLFEIGQMVEIDGYRGTLEAIGPLKAIIAAAEGNANITVPNAALMDKTVKRQT